MAGAFKITGPNLVQSCIAKSTKFGLHIVCILLGLPLLVSGVGHLANPHKFLDSVFRYQVVPNDWVPFVATILPASTAVVGVSLVLGLNVRASLISSGVLFSSFATAQLIQLLSSGKPIDCGCFVWLPHSTSFLNVVVLLATAGIAFGTGLWKFARSNAKGLEINGR